MFSIRFRTVSFRNLNLNSRAVINETTGCTNRERGTTCTAFLMLTFFFMMFLPFSFLAAIVKETAGYHDTKKHVN